MKKWNEYVAEDLNENEKRLVKNMRKELKKLVEKGFGSDLGRWLDKHGDALKEYIPEIYEVMSHPIQDKADGGGPNTTNKQYIEFAQAFKDELKKSGIKL